MSGPRHNFGGLSRPKNTGLESAHGRPVALLDCDDEWLPKKLERRLTLLWDGRADRVSCFARVIKENLKTDLIFNLKLRLDGLDG